MKVSKRCQYALRALIDMGIAQASGRALLRLGDLAAKENLPIKFLEQIFVQLKGAGFVESKRGKQGGYFLAVAASEITLGEVIRLLDGSLAPIQCVSRTEYERCTCEDESCCGLRAVMAEVHRAVTGILDHTTLADTVRSTLRKVRRNRVKIPIVEMVSRRPHKKPRRPAPKEKTVRPPRKKTGSIAKKRAVLNPKQKRSKTNL
jgi:Rrf2 family protein